MRCCEQSAFGEVSKNDTLHKIFGGVCVILLVFYLSLTMGQRPGGEDKKGTSTSSRHSKIQPPSEFLVLFVHLQSSLWNWKHHCHYLPYVYSKPAENTPSVQCHFQNTIPYGCDHLQHFCLNSVLASRLTSHTLTGTLWTANTLNCGGSITVLPTLPHPPHN